jgi:ribosomal protein S18 acetylase RimI-like enzyme
VIALNKRVTAPEAVVLPADDGSLTWRPATLDDAEAIYDCEREIGALEHPHYVVTLEEITDDLSHRWVDLARDTCVVLDSSGTVLAWGMVSLPPGQETLVRSILSGGVRPSARGRGIGRLLIAWQCDRGMQQLATSSLELPGWLLTFTPDTAESTARMFERSGLSIARYFMELCRDLAEPIEPLTLDPELRLEQFTPENSEATRLARNLSFRDHWGSQPLDEEGWGSFASRSITRGDLSSVAVDQTGAVVGLVLVSVNEEDWPGQGFSSAYVDLVGVTREWRKRGVAAALLAHTLSAARSAGLEQVVLDVDSESPTGAQGLYAAAGFTESHRTISFTRVF